MWTMPVPASSVTKSAARTAQTNLSAASALKRSNGGSYFAPTKSFVSILPTTGSSRLSFFSSVSRSLAATTYFFAPSPTTTYSNDKLIAAYMLDDKVHGVVVQTSNEVSVLAPPASSNGNSTYTLGSSTCLYPCPTSPALSAVPPCAHHQTTLC